MDQGIKPLNIDLPANLKDALDKAPGTKVSRIIRLLEADPEVQAELDKQS